MVGDFSAQNPLLIAPLIQNEKGGEAVDQELELALVLIPSFFLEKWQLSHFKWSTGPQTLLHSLPTPHLNLSPLSHLGPWPEGLPCFTLIPPLPASTGPVFLEDTFPDWGNSCM